MSDIQLAVLLAALAGLFWYVRGSLERESGPSGLLEDKAPPPPADSAKDGVRYLLWGHLASLLVCIPFLAYSPFSLDEGHSMDRWLADYLAAWLRWSGLIQLVYLTPLWRSLRAERKTAATRALLLAGGATAGTAGLAWAALLNNQPQSTFSQQAAAGILALSSAAFLFWCGRELRLSLRA